MEKIIIRFTKKAYEDYLNLPLNYKELLDRTLERFEQGIPIDIKSVHGEKDTFRIRFGKYRLVLIKLSSNVLIVKIKKREDIYKK